MNQLDVKSILENLSKFLDPQLQEIVKAIADNDDIQRYYIDIPDVNYVDLTIYDLASLVARASNVYGRAARFAGIARAQFKIIEGMYKKVYKANKVGKNEAEREANAILAAEDEYSALIAIEAIVQLAESMESAARISSESARKLMDKVQSMQVASAREDKGFYSEKDFEVY